MTVYQPAGCLGTTCTAALTPDEEYVLDASNRDARVLLREHASAFISRNHGPGEASYEAWIAQLHPENVRLDERLKTEGCEHQQIWQEALRLPTATSVSPPCGLVEISISTTFGLAVLSLDVALWLLDSVLSGIAEGAGGLRRRLIAHEKAHPTSPTQLLLLPTLLLSSLFEASFKLGSALLRTSGTLCISLLIGVGATVQGLVCVSPSAGRRFAARLHALSPRLRRRWRKLVQGHTSQVARIEATSTSTPAQPFLVPVVGTPMGEPVVATGTPVVQVAHGLPASDGDAKV